MILSKNQAENLAKLLSETGYDELSEEVNAALDNLEVETGEMIKYQRCKHEWLFPTEKEVRRIGRPSAYHIDENNEDMVKEFYMVMSGRCMKCGLPYKYKDISFKEARKRLKENFAVYVSFGGSESAFSVINDLYKEKSEQAFTEEVGRLEEKLIDILHEYIRLHTPGEDEQLADRCVKCNNHCREYAEFFSSNKTPDEWLKKARGCQI